MENQAATVTSPQLLNTETPLKAEETNPDCFKKSLQELKHLSSQLHHAANHFQSAACRNQEGASQRKLVLKSTRKYICEAIVTVVDHLGSVSYELENKFQVNKEVSEVEQRIECLAQRILTCQQYALTLDLSNIRWNFNFPRHHQHYISPSSNSLGAVVPVPQGASMFSKSSNSSIGSHPMDIKIIQGVDQKKKAVQRSPFMSFLRISQTKRSSSHPEVKKI
ncbi:hypothetical protein KFK09_005337 [Dendrobium nobile]|uniref:Protein ABIL5 n=1 Tax=Dendrobium nobile TaxID=94219 RepID=A0A8T3BYW1_DENNO|nr:hypothetical protein KFK09_005337 [Dendrobium nobile]